MASSYPAAPRTDQITVTTAAQLLASRNSNRLGIIISNVGSLAGYIGFSSALTSSNGYGIPPNGYVVIDNPTEIWGISTGTGTTLTLLEENYE